MSASNIDKTRKDESSSSNSNNTSNNTSGNNSSNNNNNNITPYPTQRSPSQQRDQNHSKGIRLVTIGLFSLAILFIIYSRYQDPVNLTPDAIHGVQRLAYGFYVAMIAAFCTIAYGMHKYHIVKIAEWNTGYRDLNSIIAHTIQNSRARKTFIITFITYGIFFSLASGTLVYQPEVDFEIHYGADIPSGFVSPCCGDIGYMPKIIIYLTNNIGLQIIPINLVLQIIVSYLVGLNAALAVGAYATSKKRRGLGTIGAATGLFIACPTCAGTFFSVFLGTASGIVLSAALAQMQTLFIAISIPVLLLTPYLIARRIRGPTQGKGCEIIDLKNDSADDNIENDSTDDMDHNINGK